VKHLDKTTLGNFVVARHEDLANKRAPWDSFCQEIADYVMPRKAQVTTKTDVPNPRNEAQLFDSTAVQSNMILANGQLSGMTPLESRWFSYDAPQPLRGLDPIEQYYRRCTEVAEDELAKSNFYSEVHEFYLDRGAFGTAVLSADPGSGRHSLLNFKKFDCGTYSIAEDDEGYVDTLSRELDITARQAVQWFGRDNVSPQILQAFDSPDGRHMERTFCFIHQIFPREQDEIEFGKRDDINMPIASIYVEKANRKVARVSGYQELPFFASRYVKWVASMPYGWSPSWMALPDARQLNFLEKQMDALAELAAFPRMLIPDGWEDEVDFRARGVTYFDPANPNAVPREWATNGRYDIGKDRADIKRKAIQEAFHVDLFRMFQNLDKEMTAREVNERAGEKLSQFAPTFARMVTELFNPLLRRVFAICAKAGRFPPPPQELIQQSPEGAMYLPDPELTYSSRIALAIKALENVSLVRSFEQWLPIMQLRPEIMDNCDLDAMFRDSCRNNGMPARWLVPFELVQEQRKARAEKQQQMEQAAQMQQGADAVSKVGNIKQDSVVGGMLSKQLNGNNPGAGAGMARAT
jgi:hypothetical protein